FLLVIGALGLLTVGLLVLAFVMHMMKPTDPNLAAEAKVTARLQPVGGVYAGDTGAAAMAAAAAAAQEAAAGQVAYGGTLDGGVIHQNLGGACHNSGAGGAPVMTRASWAGRLDQGIDTLVRHAIDGYQGEAGVMPPRGGNPSLTDEQVAASV